MSTPSGPMASPGPWTNRGFEHQKEQRRVILDANGAEIGYVVRGGDADLIVRAPVLAADLAEAVELLRAMDGSEPTSAWFAKAARFLSRLSTESVKR